MTHDPGSRVHSMLMVATVPKPKQTCIMQCNLQLHCRRVPHGHLPLVAGCLLPLPAVRLPF
eukprot:6607603-Alexandrium_andersonii.AAC.1